MKNVNSDRDSFIGRLLADTLEAHGASVPEGSCLDADTLAAWMDDTMGSRERLAAEAHAGSCARCQALLAVMMKTAPPAVAEKSAWRIPALGWLIPLTAAAAAVLVWAIVPGRATLPVSDRPVQVASDRPVAQSDRPGAMPDQVGTLPRSAPSAPPPAKAEALQSQLKPSPAPTDTSAQSSAPRDQREASPGAAGADASDKLEKVEKLDQAAPVTPRAKEPSQNVVAGDGDRVEQSAATAAVPPASRSLATVATGAARARFAAAGTVIVSSSQASRWRIAPGGAVERSINGGSTWQPQETGATVTLSGGASPSPSVCWLVGPAGTVLLSTDGRTWRRIVFPEATDLISIRATDEKIAAVTTSDGRTFSTTDGGLTWVRSGTQ